MLVYQTAVVTLQQKHHLQMKHTTTDKGLVWLHEMISMESGAYTVNFRLVVQKRKIEFQIDQSHSAKLSGLPNAIGQFTFQYCVLVDNQLEIYGNRKERPTTGIALVFKSTVLHHIWQVERHTKC